ncbi:MAG: GFA family protein [Sandaracinaceae bacterium]
MTETEDAEWKDGGCHCGAVRFRARVPKEPRVIECNCSICRKKGFLHLILARQDVRFRTGRDALVEYRFGTRKAEHLFCRTCGIHSYYIPRSHPDAIDVNARCLDGLDLDRVAVTPFDGQHWEDNVGAIR